jgi:cation transport regulator ChaC
MRNMPDGSRSTSSCTTCVRATVSGANRDYVIATVGALEQLGYRETQLHLLAERLAGSHEASAASASS